MAPAFLWAAMGAAMIELPRRRFITGIAAVICAPAIVRAASLMPVKAYRKPFTAADFRRILHEVFAEKQAAFVKDVEDGLLYGRGPYRITTPNFHGQALLNLNSFQSSFQQPMRLG